VAAGNLLVSARAKGAVPGRRPLNSAVHRRSHKLDDADAADKPALPTAIRAERSAARAASAQPSEHPQRRRRAGARPRRRLRAPGGVLARDAAVPAAGGEGVAAAGERAVRGRAAAAGGGGGRGRPAHGGRGRCV